MRIKEVFGAAKNSGIFIESVVSYRMFRDESRE